MGVSPRCNAASFSSSLSTHVTVCPSSAKQAAATNPTYPDPTTAILNQNPLLVLANPTFTNGVDCCICSANWHIKFQGLTKGGAAVCKQVRRSFHVWAGCY